MTDVYWLVLLAYLNGPQGTLVVPGRYPTHEACQAALDALQARLPLDQGAVCRPRAANPPRFVYVVPGTAPQR